MEQDCQNFNLGSVVRSKFQVSMFYGAQKPGCADISGEHESESLGRIAHKNLF